MKKTGHDDDDDDENYDENEYEQDVDVYSDDEKGGRSSVCRYELAPVERLHRKMTENHVSQLGVVVFG